MSKMGASPRVSKSTPNLDFFWQGWKKKTPLSNNCLSQLPIFKLGTIDPITWKYTSACQSANLEVEGCGEE
jgi:hypothetical protein